MKSRSRRPSRMTKYSPSRVPRSSAARRLCPSISSTRGAPAGRGHARVAVFGSEVVSHVRPQFRQAPIDAKGSGTAARVRGSRDSRAPRRRAGPAAHRRERRGGERFGMGRDESGLDPSRPEIRMVEDAGEKARVGRAAEDHGLLERADRESDRLSRSVACTISFASIGSKAVVILWPSAIPPSRRMPGPSAGRKTSSSPIAGGKSWSASSAHSRHSIATPAERSFPAGARASRPRRRAAAARRDRSRSRARSRDARPGGACSSRGSRTRRSAPG